MWVYVGHMRLLVVALAASTLVGGCACTEADLAGLPLADSTTAHNAAEPTDADTRPEAQLYLHPRDADDSSLCSGLGPTVIPCQDVINVCVGDPGSMTTMWMPEVWRCTDRSPTVIDVCRMAPAEQWAFYNLSDARCRSITG